MTKEQLDAIRARVEAATPGPWSYSISIGQDRRYATGPTHDGGLGPDDEDAREKAHADALLIAKAPTDLLALLAEVERLTTLLAGTESALDNDREYQERLKAEVVEVERAAFKRGAGAMREHVARIFERRAAQWGERLGGILDRARAEEIRDLPDPKDTP